MSEKMIDKGSYYGLEARVFQCKRCGYEQINLYAEVCPLCFPKVKDKTIAGNTKTYIIEGARKAEELPDNWEGN